MATTTTTSTNTGGIANSLNTPARADEDDVSVDCGTIGSSNDEEYIRVYRERILVGGSFFPPDNSESGSGRSEWNGMLPDISSLFPATKSENDSSSLFSPPNSNSIMAIYPPHRSTDGSENDEIIIARNPSISSYFPAYFSDTASSVSNETRLDRAYSAIQYVMSQPEDEFRHVLIRNTVPLDAERLYDSIRWRSLSFPVNDARIIAGEGDEEDGGEFESFLEDDRSLRFHERVPSLDDNALVDLIDPKAVDELREIATRMIRFGFKKKCIQVYSSVRRDALDECLVILGIEKLSIEEVQKIEWNSLDEKMKKWIQAVKIVVRLILSGEKSLCDQIFCGADETKEICFNETVKGCVMQLLNFGEAVAIRRRSPEKLFRILDMYDVMAEAMVRLEVLVTDDVVINEARDVLSRLGEAAYGAFAELENAVKSENWKKPMQSGEIHPLTQHVMNNVKLIVDYSETLLLEIREDECGPSLDDNALVNLTDSKAVDELREIATTMIRSGFKKECIQFYSTVRSNALDECLVILGIEKLSIEEVQKIEWNSLDEKMKKWIQAVKIVVRLILSSEKSLCDQIFCCADETKEICFDETVKGCVMQLLNFGKAVAIGRRSHEKLFRILDMYDVMAVAMARLEVLVTDDVVINEARDVLSRLGEATCGTFTESGEIQHLTWYVLNYVKLIVDYYRRTSNLLFEIREDDDQLEPLRNDGSDSSKLTPVARRLLVLITSLHSYLKEKSKLYEDGALQ